MNLLNKIKNLLFIPRDRILSAISEDGVHWKREAGIRQDYGGIHNTTMAYYCFVHQPDDFTGDFEMFYHSSSQIEGNWHTRIIKSRSVDGLTWKDYKEPIISGGISDLIHKQVRSPFLLKTDDCWLIYFSSQGSDGKTRIFAASSTNRETWTVIPKPILEPIDCKYLTNHYWGEVTGITDPSIVKLPDDRFRMYFSCIFSTLQNQLIASAISKDGFNWEIEDGYRIQAEPNNMCVCNPSVISYRDGWRIYYRVAKIYPIWNSIYTAYSSDGIVWEDGIQCLNYQRWNFRERNAVAFPFVMPIKNSGFRMYYTGYWGYLFDKKTIEMYQSNFNNKITKYD
jgi:predicted GH43/DUF377 family glycosyl hydrolase